MVFKNITVTFANTISMIYNTPTAPSSSIVIHVLQDLAIDIPQYQKSILLSSEMNISVQDKFISSSKFRCNSNMLIISWIKYELSELCEFCKMYPKVENFHIMPLVLQIAVLQVH